MDSGACVIFFIILRLVSRILALSVQVTEQKRLEDQIRKQYTYLKEAKKGISSTARSSMISTIIFWCYPG